jgi:hypothetical protein
MYSQACPLDQDPILLAPCFQICNSIIKPNQINSKLETCKLTTTKNTNYTNGSHLQHANQMELYLYNELHKLVGGCYFVEHVFYNKPTTD